MTDLRYLEDTNEMTGALLREVGEALENGQKISSIDVNRSTGDTENIEINFL